VAPEDIVLSERSQAQKYKYCMFSFVSGIQNNHTYRSRVEKWVGEAGGEGNGMLFREYKVLARQKE
jgi:hypothetical protein